MNRQSFQNAVTTWARETDWTLLFFLLLVTDVKTAVKIVAVAAIFLLRPNFRFGLRWRPLRESRLPLFYCAAAAIAVLNWLLRIGSSTVSQDVLLLNGLFFWALCFLIIHQLKLFVEQGGLARIHRTLSFFFLLNILVSAGDLVHIMWVTGSLNPYQFQGMDQQYFIGTGDKIRGITFDFSLTNALINAFGLVYFARRRQFALAVACMCVLLMTGSNFTNMLMVPILFVLFFFKSNKAQKILAGGCLLLMVFFLRVISPENKDYAAVTLEKLAGEQSFTVRAQTLKERKALSEEQRLFDLRAAQILQADTFRPAGLERRLPGKVISFMETWRFMQTHPAKILLGDGMGHFSSKLAFRATTLDVAGSYPAKYGYIDPDFKRNHLALYLFYFTKGTEHHSILNVPHSVYNQLVGEYGLIGLLALFVLYFGYFLRHLKKLSYGIPALLILAVAFVADYWFEQLSLVILFELLLFLDIRESGSEN
ncbi:MAG: hypothetical protein P4L51_08055 [Puia sp.]|nr:hypothetical protein [Puia sp.]